MLVGAATGAALLLISLYTPVASIVDPYEPYLVTVYALMGLIAIFCVPIIVSARNDLIWPGLALGALLILSIPALLLSTDLVVYGWFLILLGWPAALTFYALISDVEHRLAS